MAIFFFNMTGDVDFNDEYGTELADLQAAKIEAVRVAGQLLFMNPLRLLSCPHHRLSVCSEGQAVFAIDITHA